MTLLNAPIMSSPTVAFAPMGGLSAAVIKLSRATILHAPYAKGSAADAALTSLRGLKAARRRVVWCNTTELVRTGSDPRAWGEKLVGQGGANMVVACGVAAREVAVAARDAGLPLGRVVVCRDEATARNVLGDSLSAGDAVLALAIDAEACQRLAERLESKFENQLTATA